MQQPTEADVSETEDAADEEMVEMQESDSNPTEAISYLSQPSTSSPSCSKSPVISTQTQSSTLARSTPSTPFQQHKENIYTMKHTKKRKNDTSMFEKSIASTLGTMENILKGSNDNEEDEDMLFGKSIGSSLKLMKSRKIKARAKLEICGILEKYEED